MHFERWIRWNKVSYSAGVAELADAAGLGPAVPKGLGGSTPSARTTPGAVSLGVASVKLQVPPGPWLRTVGPQLHNLSDKGMSSQAGCAVKR